MNRTKIEWCDYTWNPVTGCRHGCPYCYARRMAHRFHRSFEPEFHSERLAQPGKVKKSSRIFVCSTSDLLGAWVPADWIWMIRETVQACPWHTFVFLTKNPSRYAEFNPWPENAWAGTTVTNQADADKRLRWLLKAQASVRFVSHEPLMSAIDMSRAWWGRTGDPIEPWQGAEAAAWLHWAIIGAMTGPGAVKPEPEWVQSLMSQYGAAGVPFFLKDNLCWPEKIQEFPK